MKRNRFIETQVVGILKEVEAGINVMDVCRKHGISQPTFYNWRSKYGGLSPNQLKQTKELEAEHAKLKRRPPRRPQIYHKPRRPQHGSFVKRCQGL